MNLDLSAAWQQAHTGLKQYWGYDQFRPLQGETVTSLLIRQDALVMLPTGAGKSICFQLPALLQPGLTLVVSPLISLMENQVQELRQRQLSAALLHSQLSAQQRRHTLGQLERQQLCLLYLSPESLLSPTLWPRLCHRSLRLNALIIDEAHCIVQWGTTFRPAYRRLGTIRPALQRAQPGSKPVAIAAFTATADPTTQRELQQVLQLRHPQIHRSSPYRSNLALRVNLAWTPAGRRQQILKYIQSRGQSAGLIYTRSRRESEALADGLRHHGHRTMAYHAGLSPTERRQIEVAWLEGQLPFVICTSAFGMGINKPDVRWICHFQPPLTLTEYVQEIGRAGRDGQRSQALLLVSEPTGWLDPQDQQQRSYFLAQLRSQQRVAQQLAHKLPRQGDISQVVRQFPQAEMALSLLHSSGQLRWSDPFHYQIHASLARSQTQPLDTAPIQAMARFCCTRRCRWQFILTAFGFPQEARGVLCGHCDNCQRGWPQRGQHP